ncbi:hypothetical protein SUDANB121_05977 (plasmid) [Nocardiopsis dassonvillei]|uniref:hypothetical protein n=1 Tax=Nocardiopsis dassonvillei TaxID=2014 RepID=UPI003F55ED02
MEHSEFGEYEFISDDQAADDDRWLASLPAGERALVEMMIARMCEAETDSTHRPDS